MAAPHTTDAGHRFYAGGDDAVMLHPTIDAVVAPVRLTLDDLRLMAAAVTAQHDGYLAKLAEQLRDGAGDLDQQRIELDGGDVALVSVDAGSSTRGERGVDVTLSLLLAGAAVEVSLDREQAEALGTALSLAATESEHRAPRST